MPKIHYNSPVILTYTLLSAAALALGMATDGRLTWLLFSVHAGPLTDPFFYVRLFGHVLGHAGVAHFVGNMTMLLLIGPILEEKYGSAGILKMILFTTLITGVIHALFFQTALLGASGIVFMFIILVSFVNLKKGRVPLTFLLVTALFLGREITDALTADDNIARVTHIIGGACGATLGFAMMRRGKGM